MGELEVHCSCSQRLADNLSSESEVALMDTVVGVLLVPAGVAFLFVLGEEEPLVHPSDPEIHPNHPVSEVEEDNDDLDSFEDIHPLVY